MMMIIFLFSDFVTCDVYDKQFFPVHRIGGWSASRSSGYYNTEESRNHVEQIAVWEAIHHMLSRMISLLHGHHDIKMLLK